VKTIRKRKWWLLAALLLLLTLGGGLGIYGLVRPDPHLARAEALRGQLTGEAGRGLSPEERQELRQQLAEEVRQLSPEQRQQLAAERRRVFRQRLDQYFALPPPERRAFLDGQINRMEAARRERAQAAANGDAAGAGPDRAGGFGRGAWRSADPEERQRRRREMLDATSPEERAMVAAYFRDLNNRRQQLGLARRGP
jgi:hypothetical protein